jgi:SAM-dependent methyltransferase
MQHRRVFLDEGRPDPWRGLTSSFLPAPEGEPDDPVVAYLRSVLRPDSVLLDIGAGAGRLSVPISRICKRVVAVEPSPAMAMELRHQIARRGVQNIDIKSVRWEDADQEPADVVLMSHLLYGVAPVTPYVRRAVATARDAVVVVLGLSPPGSYYHPLWLPVHGEDRIVAPNAREFEHLLKDWGLAPETVTLPGIQARSFHD